MSQYTPGPWRLDTLRDHDGPPECDEIQVQALIGNAWERIAECDWSDSVPMRAEAEANARLIAAAPDLLTALRLAYRHLNGGADSLSAMEHAEAFRLSRAAIAAATGEQP